MNGTQRAHLKRALKLARLSTERQRHGVVIAHGKRILSVAVNTARNDPTACGITYSDMSYHAERNALKQLEGRDLRKATLYSARLGRSRVEAMAKPCDACQKLIDASGIRQIFYTTN